MSFLSRRRIVALGLILGLPSLFIGYFADDLILLRDLRMGGGGLDTAARLYRFSLFFVNQPGHLKGFMPWWIQPGYRTDFLRPLSGILFWLDERLWPGGGALAHLHSLLWWALLLALAGVLLGRWLPRKLALLALLIMAVDDGHWMPMAWLANRHALVAPAAVLAGIWAHLRWRDDGWRAGLPLSLIAYAIGLSAGESALQALAYLYADELFGTGARRKRAVARLLPATALVFTYGAVRHSLGAGVEGSGVYFDPLARPLRFVTELPGRLAILLGDLLGGMPADLSWAVPHAAPFLIALGVVVTAVVAWLALRTLRLLPAEEARAVRGLAVGALLSLVPGAAGLLGSRLLLAPSLGTSVVVAAILLHLPSPRFLRGWLFAVHLILAPLALVIDQSIAIATAHFQVRSIAASELDGDVVLVTAPDPTLGIYPSYIEDASGRRRTRSWRVLSFAPLDVELERTGTSDLTLRARGGRFLESTMEKLLRDQPLVPGQLVTQEGMSARFISEAEIAFHFEVPLEQLDFVAWHDGALRTVRLPPVGGSMTIVREPGMMGLK